MVFHPVLALLSPEIIGVVVIAAVLLFGAEKLPKLARSAGQAKKEFMMGQAEADAAAEQVREQARLRAQAAAHAEENAPGTPDKGTLST